MTAGASSALETTVDDLSYSTGTFTSTCSEVIMLRIVVAAAALLCTGPALAADDDDAEWQRGRLAAGPHLTQLSLHDAESGAELDMGGMGGAMRLRASRRIGLEVSVDVLAADQKTPGDGGRVSRVTTPISGAVLLYGWPDSRFQPYLLGGVGVAGHSVRYESLGQRLDFGTPLVQFGLGFEYRWEIVRLDVSLRSLGMYRDGDEIERRPLAKGTYQPAPAGYRPLTGDRELEGAMLNVGMFWGF